MSIRRASRLRHRITIEKRSKDENDLDELGHPEAAWRPLPGVYAEVVDLSGRELEKAKQLVPEATVRVTIRYLPGLTENERVRFRDRILHIGAITDPENLRQEMILVCFEERPNRS